jgi:HEAT repeat protein
MKADEPSDPVARTAMTLCEPSADVREAALERLKALYVSCEGGTCKTRPEVARSALPYARRALVDPDPEIRVTGARAIALFAADSEESVGDLARSLEDPMEVVRLAALDALCEFGPAGSPAVSKVAERLIHAPSPDERCAAADCLSNADTEMNSLDALLHALVNDVPAVQASAAHALGCALESDQDERRMRVSQAFKTRFTHQYR